jgi:hypothetical protein
MNTKVMVLPLLLIGLMVSGCSQGMMATQAGGGSPPVIKSFFVPSEKGMYRDPIYVFLEAEDPDADMQRIAVQVTQVGYGFYPTSWTFLKPKYQKQFVGYLQWNTSNPGTEEMPEWTNISMNVTVLDRAGNQSKAVVIPYEFVTGKFPQLPLPSPFDQGKMARIGYINIYLINPQARSLGPR